MSLGPNWTSHPHRQGFYVHPTRPGWMRDIRGDWYADPDGMRSWYREKNGVIVYLAPHEPAAAERQGELTDSKVVFLANFRRRLRDREGGHG